jgi:hypothetical protein
MPGLTCNACNKEFDGDAEQKLHYKSEWHRYNLKRKVGFFLILLVFSLLICVFVNVFIRGFVALEFSLSLLHHWVFVVFLKEMLIMVEIFEVLSDNNCSVLVFFSVFRILIDCC